MVAMTDLAMPTGRASRETGAGPPLSLTAAARPAKDAAHTAGISQGAAGSAAEPAAAIGRTM